MSITKQVNHDNVVMILSCHGNFTVSHRIIGAFVLFVVVRLIYIIPCLFLDASSVFITESHLSVCAFDDIFVNHIQRRKHFSTAPNVWLKSFSALTMKTKSI